ncbi:carboxymuconolactone decarboxylase family protein [Agromyces bauzanensis]
MTTRKTAATPRAANAQGKPFIAEPRRINLLLRPWNAVVDREMGQRFVPSRLMAWDPRTVFSWVAGSLYWLFPAGKARKSLGDRIQNLVAITAAYTVNSPYCIADAVNSEPTGLSEAELEAVRAAADVSEMSSFSPRERLAIRYARLVSSTPLEFPEDFVAELTAAFTEQEIVILAALAAEMNRNARLFEALGAPPLVFPPDKT